MKKLIVFLAICLLCGIVYGAERTIRIRLTDDQQDAWEDMLGVDEANLDEAIEAYLISIASSHIRQRVDEELDKLTEEEKKSFMPTFKIKKKK